MGYYCEACKTRFALIRGKAEPRAEYIKRLVTAESAPCPDCGATCERLTCRQAAELIKQRRERLNG